MATQAAGSARYKQRAASMRRRLLVIVIVIIVLAVAAVAGRTLIFSKAKKPVASAAQPVPTLGAKQDADVALVAGAIGQYAAANNALPTHLSATSSTLVLCGDVCNPSLYSVSGFSVYNPSGIKLMSYAPGLVVPNQNTMYLVPGAKCGSNGQLGAVNTIPRSMVLLYATSSTPRCLVL